MSYHSVVSASNDSFINDGMKKKVLLIGDVGPDKSTFINTITNYSRGTAFDDTAACNRVFHVNSTENFASDEHSVRGRSSDQTDSCVAYGINDIVFIDTPILKTTPGQFQDEENMQKIREVVTKAGKIAALVFVMNGPNARMSLGIKSVINYLRLLIPDRVFANTIVVFNDTAPPYSHYDDFTKRFKMTLFLNMSDYLVSSNTLNSCGSVDLRLSSKFAPDFLGRLQTMFDRSQCDICCDAGNPCSEAHGRISVVDSPVQVNESVTRSADLPFSLPDVDAGSDAGGGSGSGGEGESNANLFTGWLNDIYHSRGVPKLALIRYGDELADKEEITGNPYPKNTYEYPAGKVMIDISSAGQFSGHPLLGSGQVALLNDRPTILRTCDRCDCICSLHSHDIAVSIFNDTPPPEHCSDCRDVVVDAVVACTGCSRTFFFPRGMKYGSELTRFCCDCAGYTVRGDYRSDLPLAMEFSLNWRSAVQ